MGFRTRIGEKGFCLPWLCLVLPQKEVATSVLGLLTSIDYSRPDLSVGRIPIEYVHLAGVTGHTPPSMVLATVLSLKVLCRRTTIAMPDAVHESTFQWDFPGAVHGTPSTSTSSTPDGKHSSWPGLL